MDNDFRSRVLAAMVGPYECIDYRSQRIMIYDWKWDHGSNILCLPFAPKYNKYFDQARSIIMCTIMVLLRLGLINDIIIYEIIPYMLEARAQLTQYKFYPELQPDGCEEKKPVCFVIADDQCPIKYSSLKRIGDLNCYQAYNVSDVRSLNSLIHVPSINPRVEVSSPTHAETYGKILVPLEQGYCRLFAADDIELVVDGGVVRYRKTTIGVEYRRASDPKRYMRCY